MNKKAFTIIELIFVIVILGILAGVAVPKLAVTRDDATMAKMRTDVASIRSGIALQKSKYMMEGNISGWRDNIEELVKDNFSGVIQGGIKLNDKPKKMINGWAITEKKDGKNYYKACIARKCTGFKFTIKDKDNAKIGEFECTTIEIERKKVNNCNLFE